MKNLIKYIAITAILVGVSSCDTIFEPIDENRLDFDFVSTDPANAEGFLLSAYNRVPDQFGFNEAATDDAVNNQLNNNFKRMALGELNAQFNPTSRWNNYESVLWANQFLEIIEAREVVWNQDEDINEMFYLRMEGEALALRGLHHLYILQAHAGIGTSGDLLGIPYITEFIQADGNFNLPRLTFEETVEAIMNDFDAALALLPTDYSDDPSLVDPLYQEFDFNKYQVVNGSLTNLRISGRVVKALKARLALMADSPAFLNGQGGYNSIAANEASELLNTIGGVAGLDPAGLDYFETYDINTTGEMIWRGSIPNGVSAGIERRMFPPSANGTGELNPTQNFVDAFPMQNGFPATEANGFDPQNPYANRDPRLAEFVVLDGSSFGGSTINTGVGGGIDRLDSIPEFSTTTGYYLKKPLHPDTRINSDGSTVGQRRYDVYFRYTELFLIFAEAANEIGGPDQQINGISARDVIAAIRQRAGLAQPDSYLATITSREDMRELIRNERRIELSFEGHRFWDLRRWNLPLDESAAGIFINGSEFTRIPSVEIRNYPSFATYLPIPNDEVIRFSALEQNAGW